MVSYVCQKSYVPFPCWLEIGEFPRCLWSFYFVFDVLGFYGFTIDMKGTSKKRNRIMEMRGILSKSSMDGEAMGFGAARMSNLAQGHSGKKS